MTTQVYDFICAQGATFKRTLTWKNQSAGGAPIDNSGHSARMQVRRVPGAPVVLELTTENSGIVLGGSNGQINLVVAAADTADLLPGAYIYDLELESPAGDVYRELEGSFIINPEVTK